VRGIQCGSRVVELLWICGRLRWAVIFFSRSRAFQVLGGVHIFYCIRFFLSCVSIHYIFLVIMAPVRTFPFSFLHVTHFRNTKYHSVWPLNELSVHHETSQQNRSTYFLGINSHYICHVSSNLLS
jgi:hypothetical protein